MKDITLLIAHPDDELLFAWPVWDRIALIVCVSSDENNPARRWCAKRKLCLEEVGKSLGTEVQCFGFDSEFYRMRTRDGELKALARSVGSHLSGTVFAHNAWGEYGHIDHLLCHHIARTTGLPMLVSDIACEVNWLPILPWKQGEFVSRHTLDCERFDSLKAVYDARGCWTWSHQPVAECGVYRIA